MGGSTGRLLIILGALAGVSFYITYGTLSPCGMLRETVRRADGLAAVLPDSLVDLAIESKIGSLAPGKCIAILLGNLKPSTAVANVKGGGVVSSKPSPPNPSTSDLSNSVQTKVEAAVLDCRKRRLSGELKTYRESGICASDRMMQIFSDAGYPYMGIVAKMSASRIAISERLDRREISEAQATLEIQNSIKIATNEEQQRQRSTVQK